VFLLILLCSVLPCRTALTDKKRELAPLQSASPFGGSPLFSLLVTHLPHLIVRSTQYNQSTVCLFVCLIV
jgi:hypothetical protein